MTTTAVPYSSALALMAGAGLNFMSGNAVAALCTSSYTPSQTGHSHFSDLSGEVTDTSYARVSLTGKATAYASGVLTLSCSDTTFPSLTATSVRYVVFGILDGVADSSSPLIGYWDLGVNQDVSVNDFVVVYHTAGFITLSL